MSRKRKNQFYFCFCFARKRQLVGQNKAYLFFVCRPYVLAFDRFCLFVCVQATYVRASSYVCSNSCLNPRVSQRLKLVEYNSTKCSDSVKRPVTDVTDVTDVTWRDGRDGRDGRDITYVESLRRRKKICQRSRNSFRVEPSDRLVWDHRDQNKKGRHSVQCCWNNLAYQVSLPKSSSVG